MAPAFAGCLAVPTAIVALALSGMYEFGFLPVGLSFLVWWLVLKLVARRGILADEEGLTELYWIRAPRHYPWDAVQKVAVWLRNGIIHTDRGDIVLQDERIRDWRRLCAEVMDRIAPPEAEVPVDEVSPEQICAWLGVPAGGALVCRQRIFPEVRFAVGFALAWLVAGLLGWFGAPWPLVGATALAAAFGFDVLRISRSPSVRADGYGLTVRDRSGRRFVPWPAVQQLVLEPPPQRRFYWTPAQMMADNLCHIGTRLGVHTFYRSDWGGPELLNGLNNVLAARAAGAALPDLGEVTDASLSRPERMAGDEAAERGLSRTGI